MLFARLSALLLPGLLVAATGVGAGDLITAALAGSAVGIAIFWAVIVGALFKWVVTEGVARWQLATGTTLLEGWSAHLGWIARSIFLVYLLLWSLAVGAALVSACGVAASAFLPLGDAQQSKIIWGIVHSLLGLAFVWSGGFRLFERIMSLMIGVMFITVIVTAALMGASADPLPHSVEGAEISLTWILAVIGGVGGTVTVMSYGYWIREVKRAGITGLRESRLDLAVAYTLTGLFGVAMITIGSQVDLAGKGAGMALVLGEQIETTVGSSARFIFLLGFWAAVFSSLLGVWQSVPYLFADLFRLQRGGEEKDLRRSAPYRGYLIFIALTPLPLLVISVKQIQLTYAILGVFFMPALAATLLYFNNQRRWVSGEFRNGWLENALLIAVLLFFAAVGIRKLIGMI